MNLCCIFIFSFMFLMFFMLLSFSKMLLSAKHLLRGEFWGKTRRSEKQSRRCRYLPQGAYRSYNKVFTKIIPQNKKRPSDRKDAHALYHLTYLTIRAHFYVWLTARLTMISGTQLGSDIHTRGTFHRLAPNADSLGDFPEGYCLRHRFYTEII